MEKINIEGIEKFIGKSYSLIGAEVNFYLITIVN